MRGRGAFRDGRKVRPIGHSKYTHRGHHRATHDGSLSVIPFRFHFGANGSFVGLSRRTMMGPYLRNERNVSAGGKVQFWRFSAQRFKHPLRGNFRKGASPQDGDPTGVVPFFVSSAGHYHHSRVSGGGETLVFDSNNCHVGSAIDPRVFQIIVGSVRPHFGPQSRGGKVRTRVATQGEFGSEGGQQCRY